MPDAVPDAVAATKSDGPRSPNGRAPAPAATRISRGQEILAKYGVLIALVITIVVFSLLKPGVFFTAANFKAIAEEFSPLAIIGFGMTVVLVMGDFDLSVAGMIGLGSAVVVWLMSEHGVDYPLAIVIGLLVGIAGGAVSGLLVAFAGASSFIITLAMGQVYNGLEYSITKQETLFNGIPNAYAKIATGSFLGLSNQFYIMLGVLVIMYLLLEQSTIGRFMYALGGNPEAARLSGIRVRELRMFGFMIVGVCAVITGVLITSQNDSQSPNSGLPFFLPAFASVFLGSAVLRPGRFNVLGTLVGAFFLEVMSTGLTELSLSTAVILLVQGVILAGAVLLSRLGRKAT
jgi:ribose transport system permease protein